MIASTSWMQEQGVSRQLIRRYVKSGWLEPFGHGAFIRAGDNADWLSGLHTLQHQFGMNVYAAADTALSLKGLGHFLPLGENAEVHLFSETREFFPAWFRKHAWGMRIRHDCPSLFESSDPAFFTELKQGELPVRISAPERAILEVLHLATTNESIDYAVELMEGLNTLRPQVLQQLLDRCRSVKVKRLFLWSSEAVGHEWFSRLETNHLDLGKGKISLYRGGKFDQKYQVTVPIKAVTANV